MGHGCLGADPPVVELSSSISQHVLSYTKNTHGTQHAHAKRDAKAWANFQTAAWERSKEALAIRVSKQGQRLLS